MVSFGVTFDSQPTGEKVATMSAIAIGFGNTNGNGNRRGNGNAKRNRIVKRNRPKLATILRQTNLVPKLVAS